MQLKHRIVDEWAKESRTQGALKEDGAVWWTKAVGFVNSRF